MEERPGGLRYRCGTTYFVVFASAGAPSGTHTQMSWAVTDLEATMAALRARGVVFEEYDLPGLVTTNSIAVGGGAKTAWFKDTEGNILAISELL